MTAGGIERAVKGLAPQSRSGGRRCRVSV